MATNFKTGSNSKVERRKVKAERKYKEDAEMRYVRRRDRWCRFPLCGCAKFGLVLDVSHQRHRGMGGNPAGDRTDRSAMLLICRQRHRVGRVAIDRGTLRWEGRTLHGAEGPIAWFVDAAALGYPGEDEIELAREWRPGQLEVLTLKQRRLLLELARMTT
jgi:hypothetical protein